MIFGVRKGAALPTSAGSVHKSKALPDDLVRFSFRHLHANEKFCLPDLGAKPEYIPTLLDRLKHVSNMRMSEFRQAGKVLRSHAHEWHKTSEPNGYSHLSQQLQDCQAWQFSLAREELGRVHGILIDDVFYIIWLDPEHRMYPGR